MNAARMTTEELFLTLHWRGWTFESNGQGVMFIWRRDDPFTQLLIDACGDLILRAGLTPEVVGAIDLIRLWQAHQRAAAAS